MDPESEDEDTRSNRMNTADRSVAESCSIASCLNDKPYAQVLVTDCHFNWTAQPHRNGESSRVSLKLDPGHMILFWS